jgi:hypothetical protein
MNRFAGFIRRRGRAEKLLLTVLTVGVVGSLAAFGVFSAFSETTSNTNNSFAAGSVHIGGASSSVGTAFYSVPSGKPGDSSTAKCAKITYTGSLPANVSAYRSAFTSGTGLDQYVTVEITRGSGTGATAAGDGSCTGFAAGTGGAGNVYSGTLSALGTSFGTGQSVSNASDSTTWSQNDAEFFRVVATLPSAVSNNANGLSTGTHSISWEAQNT